MKTKTLLWFLYLHFTTEVQSDPCMLWKLKHGNVISGTEASYFIVDSVDMDEQTKTEYNSKLMVWI